MFAHITAALVALATLASASAGWLFLLGPWRAVDLSGQAPALPPVLENIAEQRPVLLAAFERHVYGPAPAAITPVVSRREAISPEQAGGVHGVEQWRVELGAAGYFHLAIVRPPGDAPAPVILVLDFCGNRAAFPGRPQAIAAPVGHIQWFCRLQALDPILRTTLGRYVNGPPLELIASHGYAVALLYAGDIAPDDAAQARAALARFAPNDTGALMAWAWTASRAYEALAADPRLDARRIALFGQSRQGKAALVAGAFDQRFAAVVALQSGRGGDAPTRGVEGESLTHMLRAYPHWFSPHYGAAAPVDQHELLALIAPRPLLVGHARRDVWSDPVGARAVREAAAPAFVLCDSPPPGAFVREGGHGINRRDWLETLSFLDARL